MYKKGYKSYTVPPTSNTLKAALTPVIVSIQILCAGVKSQNNGTVYLEMNMQLCFIDCVFCISVFPARMILGAREC